MARNREHSHGAGDAKRSCDTAIVLTASTSAGLGKLLSSFVFPAPSLAHVYKFFIFIFLILISFFFFELVSKHFLSFFKNLSYNIYSQGNSFIRDGCRFYQALRFNENLATAHMHVEFALV